MLGRFTLVLTFTSFIVTCQISCKSKRERIPKNYFRDSVALHETKEILRNVNSKGKISWPSPVKGFPHYHYEKPIVINEHILIYLIRDYLSNTVERWEDFVFYDGKVIFYKYDYNEKNNIKWGKALYQFNNENLVDSFIHNMPDPIPVEAVINKARRSYYLAINRVDSLLWANQSLKDSLDAWRKRKNNLTL